MNSELDKEKLRFALKGKLKTEPDKAGCVLEIPEKFANLLSSIQIEGPFEPFTIPIERQVNNKKILRIRFRLFVILY